MNSKVSLGLEITLICAGLLSLWLVLDYQYAHGIDYKEIEEWKTDLENDKQSIKQLTRQIVDYKIQIRNLEQLLQSQLGIERDLIEKSRTDWNAIDQVTEIQTAINNTQSGLSTFKNRLSATENQLAILENATATSEHRFELVYEQYKIDNTFDPSGYTKLVGISLSESCTNLIQNNYNHTCPTYRQLLQLDTSNRKISGGFGVYDGLFQRGPTEYENSWRWYDNDPTLRVIVDPPGGQRDRIKMITIENNFHTYFEIEDRLVANNTRTFQEYRYVDNCHNAVINSGNWTTILADTIYYLRTGCEHTLFNSTTSVTMNQTAWNPADSPNYQYRLWLEKAMNDCLGLCITTSSSTKVN